MLKELDDHDWAEAFGEPECNNQMRPEAVHGYSGYMGSFTREDVSEIKHIRQGENDEAHWLIVCLLHDGRCAFINSWCDYTGWDCRSEVCCKLASNYDDMLRWGVPVEIRQDLGIGELK